MLNAFWIKMQQLSHKPLNMWLIINELIIQNNMCNISMYAYKYILMHFLLRLSTFSKLNKCQRHEFWFWCTIYF